MFFVRTPPRATAPTKPFTRHQNNQSNNFKNLVFTDTQYTQSSPIVGKCDKKKSSIHCGQYWEKESVCSEISNRIQPKEPKEAEFIKQMQEQRCVIGIGQTIQNNRQTCVKICNENYSHQQSNCMKDLLAQNNNQNQQMQKPSNSRLMNNILKDNENCEDRFPTREKKFYEMQQEKQVVQVQREIAEERPRFYEKRC